MSTETTMRRPADDATAAATDLQRAAASRPIAEVMVEARTHYAWQDRPVSDALLHQVYDMAKLGPTSMNQQPMRMVIVRSQDAKDRLEPCLFSGNRPKMQAASVTVIIGYDPEFHHNLPRLFPVNPDASKAFVANSELAELNALRNSTLQGAWMLVAARAHGLDVGPMSGFDNAAVDRAFFEGTAFKSNFLMNLGYADPAQSTTRLPRLEFDEVAQVL